MNNFDAIIKAIILSFQVINQEKIFLAQSVQKNAEASRVGKGKLVEYPIVPEAKSRDYEVSMNPTAVDGQTVGVGSMTIDYVKEVPFVMTGEDFKNLDNMGLSQTIMASNVQQAIRTLNNEIENSIMAKAYKEASRAYGVAGTRPFGTADDLSDFNGLATILDDNGTSEANRYLALNSYGYGNLQSKMSSLFNVDKSGDTNFLRKGTLGDVLGFNLGKTQSQITHATGSATGYSTAEAVVKGDKVIAVDSGSGTFKHGDIVKFADDPLAEKYLVKTELTTAGDLGINNPYFMGAIDTGKAITSENSYRVAGLAYTPDAITFLSRLPALPPEGDSAMMRRTVTDPYSKISYDIAYYGGKGMGQWYISTAWGVSATNGQNIALLIG